MVIYLGVLITGNPDLSLRYGSFSSEMDHRITMTMAIAGLLSYSGVNIIDSKNELAYDSDAFENININSTRRYGFELSTNNKFFNNVNLFNNFTIAKSDMFRRRQLRDWVQTIFQLW